MPIRQWWLVKEISSGSNCLAIISWSRLRQGHLVRTLWKILNWKLNWFKKRTRKMMIYRITVEVKQSLLRIRGTKVVKIWIQLRVSNIWPNSSKTIQSTTILYSPRSKVWMICSLWEIRDKVAITCKLNWTSLIPKL